MSKNHPCFDPEAKGKHGRIHLPVAPRCNVQCGFCNRKFDCVNESRPGVTSEVLKPDQAMWYLDEYRELDDRLSVMGIAGPGDPFANPVETMETLRLTKAKHPDLALCVATNGLGLPQHVEELAQIGVSHITVTVNAIDPEIGQKIYRWVRDGEEVLRGFVGARRLLVRQMDAIRRAVRLGITIKVNTIVIPTINDHHIVEIAKAMGEMGVGYFNMMPMMPVKGTMFADLPAPSKEMMHKLRQECRDYLPQLSHCGRCRADAAGLIGEHASVTATRLMQEASTMESTEHTRPYVAVASMEGVLVNMGLGKADKLLVYKETEDSFDLVDARMVPAGTDHGPARWEALAEVLGDCRAVVAAEAGKAPVEALGRCGIAVHATEGMIEDALELVYSGQPDQLRVPMCDGSGRKCGSSCGEGSGGGGGMCA